MRILFIALATLFYSNVFAQNVDVGSDNRYFISCVQNVDSISAGELFNRAVAWVSQSYKYPDRVISSKDKDAGILVVNGIANSSSISGGFEMRLSLMFKDGRYKWEMNDICFPYNEVLNMKKRRIEGAPRYNKFDDKAKKILLSDLKEYIQSFTDAINTAENW